MFKESRKRMLLLSIVFLVILSACNVPEMGNSEMPDAPTWWEQYDLGMRYLSEGNYQEAILAFTAAIEIDPMNPKGYLGASEAYIGLNRAENAIAILEEGLLILPEDASLLIMHDELISSTKTESESESSNNRNIEINGEEYSRDLTSLDLSEQNLTDSEIEGIGDLLELSSLDLSGNQIQDLSILRELTRLEKLTCDLYLVDYLISSSDLETLKSLTNLKSLWVFCYPTAVVGRAQVEAFDAQVAELESVLPECDIFILVDKISI